MNIRFALLPKILAWFFLNLLVLGAVFYVVLKVQFRFGLDSLLAGAIGERIQAASDLIVHELTAKPVADWNEVLKNFGRAYKVQFTLFRRDGTQVAGDSLTLPAEVLAKISEQRHGLGEGLGRGPPPGKGPRRPREATDAAPEARYLLRTEAPTRYWVGVSLPLTEPEASLNSSPN